MEKRKLEKLHYSLEWPRVRRYYQNEMLPILNKIQESDYDWQLRYPLTKYLIITNVSVIEDFLGNLARRIVDENNLDVTELLPVEAKLAVQTGELTKGQVISMSYSYSNLTHIDYVFSNMLKFSFIDYILKTSRADPDRNIGGAILLHKNWKKFENMFETRNKIVHAMKDVELSKRAITSLCENTISFMDIASTLRIPEYCKELAERYGNASTGKQQK